MLCANLPFNMLLFPGPMYFFTGLARRGRNGHRRGRVGERIRVDKPAVKGCLAAEAGNNLRRGFSRNW